MLFFSSVDHAGIASIQPRHFLFAMDSPPDQKTWERTELEIDPNLLLVAEKCNAALAQ